MSGFDLGFVRRVYRTSAIVYAIVALCVLAYAGVPAWLGLTAGVALALGSLRLIEWSVERFVAAVRGEQPAPRALLMLIAGAKYLLLGLAIAAVVWAAQLGVLDLPAFVGGIVLVHAVIALKAVGAWLVSADARRQTPDASKRRRSAATGKK
jgi:hypothetical protein